MDRYPTGAHAPGVGYRNSRLPSQLTPRLTDRLELPSGRDYSTSTAKHTLPLVRHVTICSSKGVGGCTDLSVARVLKATAEAEGSTTEALYALQSWRVHGLTDIAVLGKPWKMTE
ncbi:hypothetical protein NL676_029741 [Syzygium grande]|nr:hypothetical protein NL676_029741 [Syzygium grande]